MVTSDLKKSGWSGLTEQNNKNIHQNNKDERLCDFLLSYCIVISSLYLMIIIEFSVLLWAEWIYQEKIIIFVNCVRLLFWVI